MESIQKYYIDQPVNLKTINYFSCDAIFCSVLQKENMIIDINYIYKRLNECFKEPKLKRLIKDAHFVTPENCVWYYGEPWSKLSSSYIQNLILIDSYEIDKTLPYHNHAWQFVFKKN